MFPRVSVFKLFHSKVSSVAMLRVGGNLKSVESSATSLEREVIVLRINYVCPQELVLAKAGYHESETTLYSWLSACCKVPLFLRCIVMQPSTCCLDHLVTRTASQIYISIKNLALGISL